MEQYLAYNKHSANINHCYFSELSIPSFQRPDHHMHFKLLYMLCLSHEFRCPLVQEFWKKIQTWISLNSWSRTLLPFSRWVSATSSLYSVPDPYSLLCASCQPCFSKGLLPCPSLDSPTCSNDLHKSTMKPASGFWHSSYSPKVSAMFVYIKKKIVTENKRWQAKQAKTYTFNPKRKKKWAKTSSGQSIFWMNIVQHAIGISTNYTVLIQSLLQKRTVWESQGFRDDYS